MSRRLALRSEFLAGRHETTAKESFPIPIGHDARCQGIVLVDEPSGQAQTVGSLVGGWLMKRGGKSRLDRLALIEVVAAMLKSRRAAIVGLFAKNRHGRRRPDAGQSGLGVR